ncbi:ankyrin [Aspergillus steynii IBT 23096]|uniref:Ankyrin n=1 Tax=Aspergillus steynii IBT 23096 TaxID=1392250 RepID=A0A2I2GS92_9EURO|nr:ankyrin [Aspergillus steynii IBT 23096]PLB55742.1 ankyrin [Aspergillus steynii IBT 23096]
MMDPLSVIASVAGIATATFQIIGFLSTIKGGGKERLSLLNELTHLWLAVIAVQARFAPDGDSPDKKPFLAQLRPFEFDGIISDIETVVEHLESKLKSRSSYGKVRRTLVWPLDKQEVTQAIERIHRLQQTLQLALSQSTQALAQEIYHDGQFTRSVISEAQRKDIIEWLSPLNFMAKQRMIFAEHHKGTCRWFLERKDYLAWKAEDNAMLFCAGIPGAGKTVLSSIVAHELDGECDVGKAATLMLYCKWDDALSQSIDTLMGSLVKQVIQKYGIGPQESIEIYSKHSGAGTKPDREEILLVLTAELSRFSKTFIIVDGLDELRQEKTRIELLGILTSINATVNVMITSRGLDNIVRHFHRNIIHRYCSQCLAPCPRHHFHCPDCRSLSSDPVDFNLCHHRGHVLRKQFSNLKTYVHWRVASSEFLCHIVDTVVMSNDGMFLLAKFNMDTLTSKLRPAEVMKALDSLPKELDGTYTDAMLRIADLPSSHREVVMELLRREIEHAIAVADGDRDIDCDNIILVFDETENFFSPTKLASTCLTYLLFDVFQSGACSGSSESAEFDGRIEKYPFLNYAAKFWGKHLLQAPHGNLYDRAWQILQDPNYLAASTQALWYLDDEDSASWAGKNGSSALHLATHFGLNKLVTEILAKDVDPNIKDMNGTAPLALAAKKGSVNAAATLIRAGASINAAARHDQEEMVKLLVEQDGINRTPLMIASTYGYTGIIRLLLLAPQLEINQESLSSEIDAVQLLLNHSGTTALIYAAQRGDRKIAEALLDKGADMEVSQKESGGTALHQMLLGRGANVHHQDNFGRSPLHSAACNGRTELVRILLEFDKSLDVNLQDNNGKTTLHDVALYHGADPTIRDNYGRTPMRIAREMNEAAIMELLRATQEGSENKQSESFSPLPLRRTNTELCIDKPLSLWALAKADLIEELRTHLSNGPSDEINLTDPDLGQTALHYATANNNAEMVELLVTHGADLNIGNAWERKPLHLAALHDSTGPAEILLKAGAQVDAKDQWGHTPLTIASTKLLPIATLLISNGADLSDGRLNLNKLLGLAVENGNQTAVRRLVTAGAELWRKSSLGYTPFMVAKMHNHTEIANLILELGQFSGSTTSAVLPITDSDYDENQFGASSLDGLKSIKTSHNESTRSLSQNSQKESEGIDVGQKQTVEPNSTKTSKELGTSGAMLRKGHSGILFWRQRYCILLHRGSVSPLSK